MEISKLEKIEDLYTQYDFMKLISKYWISKEEYNNEALDLAMKLNCYDTIASIQQKVWDVFYDKFCVNHASRGRVYYFSKEEAIKKIGDVDRYAEFATKVKEILDE
jgi:hypothetical protein